MLYSDFSVIDVVCVTVRWSVVMATVTKPWTGWLCIYYIHVKLCMVVDRFVQVNKSILFPNQCPLLLVA